MNGIYSCVIAISMYSKIPMPTVEWTKERMRHVMCFFPVVGLLLGAAAGLWFYLGLEVFRLGPQAVALAGTAAPLLVTGGIHMDGFMDTMDAIHSYGDREKKLAILKDPHLGAFAVISLAVYLLLYLGAVSEYVGILQSWRGERGRLLYGLPGLVFVMERAFSGLSVLCFPSAKKDGLAAGFAQAAGKGTDRIVLTAWIILCLAGAAGLGSALAACSRAAGTALAAAGGGMAGTGCAAGAGILALGLGMAQLLVFGWYYRMSSREFGGITGDLAGWFLQVCELASLVVAVALLRSGVLGGGLI